jgi:C4-dicarboxylate-specific signal transduction histidine kinase
MNDQKDNLCRSGLQFFGKMTASISHEINNVLAIINENNGLLQDYALMADKGMPFDPSKFRSLTEKINIQIKRAEVIIRNMNQFAHSVDESVKDIDLFELLEHLKVLSNRSASMRGITIELIKPLSPIHLITNDFYLENLLWLCLDFAMDKTGEDNTIVLETGKKNGHVIIRMTRLIALNDTTGEKMLMQHAVTLLAVLKGHLKAEYEAGEMVLTLPLDINH